MGEVNHETRVIIAVADLAMELKAITRRLHNQNREATTEEKARIIELQRQLYKARRGELQ